MMIVYITTQEFNKLMGINFAARRKVSNEFDRLSENVKLISIK